MRTTLDIADDVLQAVKEQARREGRTMGEVLSDLARIALTGSRRTATKEKAIHGFQPFPSRGVVVTNELIDRLRETTDAY